MVDSPGRVLAVFDHEASTQFVGDLEPDDFEEEELDDSDGA